MYIQARTVPPALSGQQFKEALSQLPWFFLFLGPLMDIVVFSLFWPCLFNLLVKFVSFRLQQFEVRLMMTQGIRPIPGDSGAGLPRFLEHSMRSSTPSGQAGVCGPCQAGGSLGEETLGHIPLGIRV